MSKILTISRSHQKKLITGRWKNHVYKTKEEKLKKQRKRSLRWSRKNKPYFQKHYKENKDKIDQMNKHNYYLKEYGITPEQKEELLKLQNYGCKVCNKKITTRAHLDHSHETGKIRGILCNSCNMALGLFQDDIQLLKNAIEYLKGGE